MENKVTSRIIEAYDNYLNSLKHISKLGIDVEAFNQECLKTTLSNFQKYLNFNVNDAHKELVNKLINSLLSREIGFDKIPYIKDYINHPDFVVSSYVSNPYTFYNGNSLEQTVIAAPLSELYLIIDGTNNIQENTRVLRIARLELSYNINIFYFKDMTINGKLLSGILANFEERFKERFNGKPNKDDYVLLTNMAIRALKEKFGEPCTIENFYSDNYLVSYNYKNDREKILNDYMVYYKDNYKTLTNIDCPWIYNGIVYLDNRDLLLNGDPTTLEIQKARRKQRLTSL